MKWMMTMALLLVAGVAEAGGNRVLLVQDNHCNQRVQAVRVQRVQRVQLVQQRQRRNVQVGLLNISR